ncbi:MAG: hypothetical protein LBE12_16175, partial [Planctomycetaceae bacterium]|nr:hypothetical protein [Planctomycetaceae bacterium]
ARYYDPATGLFNRLDPFFGNLNDPQSLHKYLYTHADPINGIDPMGLSLCSSLGNLAIATGIAGLSGTAIIGAHNATMHGGKFLPDAMIFGGSVTFSLKTLENLAQMITKGFSSYISHFESIGLPSTQFLTTLYNQISTIDIPPQLTNTGSSIGNFLYQHFSITIGVDYVGSQTEKNSNNAFFIYLTLQLTSAKTDVIPNGSIYTGFIWNMPEIDNYRGGVVGFGGEYGVGIISIGMNYFVSLSPNANGTYTRGFTFGWNFGTPSKGLEVSGTYTHAWGPFWEH